MPATPTPQNGTTRSPWFEDLVILLTLVSFAVAQTVYEILSSNPEFLGARRVTNPQLLAVVAVFGLLPAFILGALWALSRRLGPLHRGVFSGLIAVFSLAVFWQGRNTYLGDGDGLRHSPWLWIIPSLGLAFLAWRNERGFRSFLLALSPAILIFPALFLYRTWRSPIAPPPLVVSAEASTGAGALTAPNGTPVFFLVFDELGLHALLNEDGQIDAGLYPAFAKLAAETHWFRNATSNSAKTISSIATLVTGNMPLGGDSNHGTYPNTIFTLLAPSYDVYIEEVGNTYFCDSEAFYCLNDATGDATPGLLRDLGYLLADRVLPAKLDVGLPDTTHTWGPFDSAGDWTRAALARSRRVLHAIDALGARDVLFFAHLILPHSPYTLTPEGEIYGIGPYALDEGQDSAILASLTERYRMQVRYVDHWLGQFLDRMKQRGLYDPALLIVTSDHGVSWKPEAPGRKLQEQNAEMMLSVPLFLKLPFQTEPGYSERDVQHIDLAPTIAAVLETQAPFPIAGRSVFGPEIAPRPKVAYGDEMVRFEFDDRLGMKAVETHPVPSALVGQTIDSFTVAADESLRGKLEGIQLAPPDTPEFAAATPIMVSGWALRIDPVFPTIESSAVAARSGKNGLFFRGPEGGARQTLAGLSPGGHYQAHAWVRSGQGGAARAEMRVRTPDWKTAETAAKVPTSAFQQISLDFTAPAGGEMLIEFHSQGAGRLHWDDVAVREIGPRSAADAAADAGPNLVANPGFEEPLAAWSAYGRDRVPADSPQSFEVAVTLNGEIVAATRPGAERWDVATQLLTPMHRYLRCGWSVSIAAERVQEGENPLQAYAILDPERRIAVRLDSGYPRTLVRDGDSIDRKMP